MRVQHYYFAHRLLPALLFKGHSLLGILANPANQEFLLEKWEEAFQEACERMDLHRRCPFLPKDCATHPI
ncbi:MAG: hypothetical protein HQM09_24320 [Candidatus Riflebacteria bacterium]|nr:hypothetical protein [Candidatus Riflebacteria bacterium]